MLRQDEEVFENRKWASQQAGGEQFAANGKRLFYFELKRSLWRTENCFGKKSGRGKPRPCDKPHFYRLQGEDDSDLILQGTKNGRLAICPASVTSVR